MHSKINHAGLFPEPLKASITFSRLAIFFLLASEVDSFISVRNSSESFGTSILFKRVRTASAPMPALKFPPNSSIAFLYWSSVRISPSVKLLSPFSVTT